MPAIGGRRINDEKHSRELFLAKNLVETSNTLYRILVPSTCGDAAMSPAGRPVDETDLLLWRAIIADDRHLSLILPK